MSSVYCGILAQEYLQIRSCYITTKYVRDCHHEYYNFIAVKSIIS